MSKTITTPTVVLYDLGLESLPFTRVAILKAETRPESATVSDFNDSTNAEAIVFTYPLPANCRIADVLLDVPTLLQNSADAAFNNITVQVGDNTAANTFIPATQVALNNGSPVQIACYNQGAPYALTSSQNATTAAVDLTTSEALANALKANYNQLQADVAAIFAEQTQGVVYTAANNLKITVTPQSGKNLSALTSGEIRVYVALQKGGAIQG